MPIISVPTTLVAMMWASVGLAVITFAVWKWVERHPALLLWGGAHLTWGIASWLLSMRGVIPDTLSILLANGLIVVSSLGIWWGMARFAGRPMPLMQTAIVFITYSAIFPWLTWISPNFSARVLLVRALMLFAVCGAVCVALRNPQRVGGKRATLAAAVSLAPMGLLFLVGTSVAGVVLWQSDGGFLHSQVMAYSGLTAMIGNLAWGIGVLFLLVERRSGIEVQDATVHHFLTEQSVVGMYMIEGERFTYVNKACADIFGLSPQVLVDEMRVTDLAVPEDKDRLADALQRYARGELEGRRYHYRVRRHSGEVTDVEGEARLTHWQGRNVLVGVMIATNGTGQISEDSATLSSFSLEASAPASQ